MSQIKRHQSESDEEYNGTQPSKSTPKKSKPANGKNSKSSQNAVDAPSTPSKGSWTHEEEMALILKAFGGKLPTLTNRDVEELSAELGRTASSIRTYYTRRIKAKIMGDGSPLKRKASNAGQSDGDDQ